MSNIHRHLQLSATENLSSVWPIAYTDAASSDGRFWQHATKRGLDITLASAMLLILLPVMVSIALVVWLDGKSAIFGHARVGRGGRIFRCLKFRSMVPNAEQALAELLARDPDAAELWSRSRKLQHDPRITWIGRFLRATSLDELPQLFNVVRGDMSLVGPRPVVSAELTEHYGPAAATYMAVRPGITGLWQVSGRSDTSYAERVALDVRYVQHFSFWGDLKILAKTVPAVLLRRGAR
jgi:lipopolysaccharide/colanic/teichoic acid biosynthesis glycosyltransferase